jgi:hypothetical protein
VAVVVAAVVLGLGGLAVAIPTLVGTGAFGSPAVSGSQPPRVWRGSGMGDGAGMGNGAGMGTGMGTMVRDGSCLDPALSAEKGTLTGQQESTLVAVAQEEKLAHDLYVAFGARYDLVVFDRIAAAEARHLDVVRALLDRYGLADPTAGRPAGQFSDPTVQADYERLLAQGLAGQAAALAVGAQVEQADIDSLRAGLDGLTAPDVRQVYTQLLAASEHHLTAFTRWSNG